MTYTTTQVFVETQRIFGDESGVQMTQSDVLAWINESLREICMQNDDAFPTTEYVNGVTGQSQYSLSGLQTPYVTVQLLYYRAGDDQQYYRLLYKNPIEFSNYVDFNNAEDTGDPVFYTKEMNTIRVWPTPVADSTQGFKIMGTGNHPTVVDGDDLEAILPPYYINSIKAYVMVKAYEMDENWEASQIKGQQFQTNMNYNYGRNNDSGAFAQMPEGLEY